MRLLVIAVAFVLLAFQPAPAPITVADCLLQSGYSRAVPATPVTELAGVNAWVGGLGERVLIYGRMVGMEYIEDSDGATRMVSFHVWAGSVYAFVYMAENDPHRRLPGDPDGTWHGDCLIRLVSP